MARVVLGQHFNHNNDVLTFNEHVFPMKKYIRSFHQKAIMILKNIDISHRMIPLVQQFSIIINNNDNDYIIKKNNDQCNNKLLQVYITYNAIFKSHINDIFLRGILSNDNDNLRDNAQ